MADAVAKGRISRGEKHSHAIRSGVGIPGAKLRPDQVQNIWTQIQDGMRLTKIAEKYNVTTGTISAIKRGATWNHITGAKKWAV
jgi:hypothetical protein